jgi:hypothetical protein
MSAAVGVVHLASSSLGIDPFLRFLRSYRAHDAGVQHDLIVVLNGFRSERVARPFLDGLAELEHEPFGIFPRVSDLTAYRRVADALDQQVLCFLNSRSVVLAEGWLGKLHHHGSRPDVGAAAASGTWETHLTGARTPVAVEPAWRLPRPHRAAAELARRLVLPRYERTFPPFPNPHIRTNAFLVRRDVFRALDWPTPRSKFAAHALESGHGGLTRQLEERGLRCVVVGRDGHAYRSEEWPKSATFRSGDQGNLLVGDRRTEEYEQAGRAERERLAELAWGTSVRRASGH